MLLNGNTMTNLEIYQNQTDFTTHGTLMSILDHTSTKFGARLLKNWIGKPLTNRLILNQRIDAVEEIKSSKSPQLVELCRVLKRLPDLAKGLCRIQYGKCTCQELASLLSAFATVTSAFPEHSEEFRSKLLNDIFSSLPKLKAPIQALLATIDIKKANSGRKDELWTDSEQFPALDEYKLLIETVKSELDEELKSSNKFHPQVRILPKLHVQFVNFSENHPSRGRLSWALSTWLKSRSRKIERCPPIGW